ncbi:MULTISPECIES: hypothetical protein [unclassified Bradyrhizobium]
MPRIAASPSLKRVHGAPISAPPSEPVIGRARANVPARGASLCLRRRGPRKTGIRFAPKRSRLVPRSAALLFSRVRLGETMTVYLISLALAGLVAIVVWEISA